MDFYQGNFRQTTWRCLNPHLNEIAPFTVAKKAMEPGIDLVKNDGGKNHGGKKDDRK